MKGGHTYAKGEMPAAAAVAAVGAVVVVAVAAAVAAAEGSLYAADEDSPISPQIQDPTFLWIARKLQKQNFRSQPKVY
jgi:hypothetical protein